MKKILFILFWTLPLLAQIDTIPRFGLKELTRGFPIITTTGHALKFDGDRWSAMSDSIFFATHSDSASYALHPNIDDILAMGFDTTSGGSCDTCNFSLQSGWADSSHFSETLQGKDTTWVKAQAGGATTTNADSLGHQLPKYYRDSVYWKLGTSWSPSGWKGQADTIKVDTTIGGGTGGITVKDTTLQLRIAAFTGSASMQYYTVSCTADYVQLFDFWMWNDTTLLSAGLTVTQLRISSDTITYISTNGKLPSCVAYNIPTTNFANISRQMIMKNESIGSTRLILLATNTNYGAGRFIMTGEADSDSFYYITGRIDKTWDTLTISPPLISAKDSGSYCHSLGSTIVANPSTFSSIILTPRNNKIHIGIIGGSAGAVYHNVYIRFRARMWR